jgi:hypothetical protein
VAVDLRAAGSAADAIPAKFADAPPPRARRARATLLGGLVVFRPGFFIP